jgi:hypothetical protein
MHLIKDRMQCRTIGRIRIHLLFFGFDVSHLSDDELLEGIMDAGLAISQSGVTVDEAATSLRALGREISGKCPSAA